MRITRALPPRKDLLRQAFLPALLRALSPKFSGACWPCCLATVLVGLGNPSAMTRNEAWLQRAPSASLPQICPQEHQSSRLGVPQSLERSRSNLIASPYICPAQSPSP